MNRKIVSVLLVLTVISLIGIPGALAGYDDNGDDYKKKVTPKVTKTPKVTETEVTPTVTKTPKVTETPIPTGTAVVTQVTPIMTTPAVTTPGGGQVPVPEFPTLVLPMAAVIGLIALLLYRRE